MRPTTIFVIAAALAGFVYGLHLSVVLDTLVVVGATAAGTVLIAAAARRHPRGKRLPWYLLAAGMLAWTVSWCAWQAHLLASGAPPDPGSFASTMFLPGYAFIMAALLVVMRRHEGGGGGVLDVGIVGSALLLATWTFLIHPLAIEAPSGFSVIGRTTQIVFLLFDIGLFAAFTRFFLAPGKRTTSYRLLGCAIAVLLLGDVPWNWLTLTGSYSGAGALTDGGLAMCPLLFAAAASASRKTSRSSKERQRRSPAHMWAYLITMAAALLVIPVVLTVSGRFAGPDTDLVLIELSVSAVLVLLVVARLGRFLSEERFWIVEREEQVSIARALAIAEQQNDRLQKLHSLKDAFVATVSHELRTPLTSIRGYLELVLEGEAGELTQEQREFLGVVDRNSARLLTLVGDLLFVAQVEAGEFTIDPRELDVAVLAQECLESARPVAAELQLTLTGRLDAVPPVLGDAARLGQVLDNLLSNALKFTPPGGTVELRVRRVGDRAVIDVVDSGPGISALEQELLFERFFRTPAASDRAVPGTGLGLAIAKAIAEAHKGTVSVQSTEGGGSTFTLELPLAPPARAVGSLVAAA